MKATSALLVSMLFACTTAEDAQDKPIFTSDAGTTALCGQPARDYRAIDQRALHPLGATGGSSGSGMRIKPYSALAGDYQRIFGTLPSAARDAASAFGVLEGNWYTEPKMGAVSLYVAHRIAYGGCLAQMPTRAGWADKPSPDSANQQCAEWALTFWRRRATTAELSECTAFLLDDALFSAATPPMSMGERWASGCALMLSSPEFLTY